MSQEIGYNSTNLSLELIKGRRPLTEKSAKVIAKSLKLNSQEKKYFLKLVAYKNEKSPGKKASRLNEILELKNLDQDLQENKISLEIYTKWYRVAIYELASFEDFQPNAKWINARLRKKLSKNQIDSSLDLLFKTGALKENKDGRIIQDQSISTPSRFQGLSVLAFHEQILNLTSEIMFQTPGQERYIDHLSLSLSDDEFADLREILDQFMSKIHENQDKNEKSTRSKKLYHLNMQLLPITRKEEGK